jgi:hypothetical protein
VQTIRRVVVWASLAAALVACSDGDDGAPDGGSGGIDAMIARDARPLGIDVGIDAEAAPDAGREGCLGTATECTEQEIDVCMMILGCSWNGGACEGTATSCEDIGRGDCHLQPGCESPPIDGGARDASMRDAGPRPDGGPAACGTPEGPLPFEGCNPESGIECDGDWSDRCTPACSATECCIPLSNSFTCVERGDGGACPAPDLWVDDTRLAPYFEYRAFAEGDCAIAEGCVGGPGVRRLLRFDTWTPNTGGADMYLGVPSPELEYFTYSECHDHYHFDSYAEYELLSSDETCVAAQGHKQAFCLLDYYSYPCDPEGTDPAVPDCRRLAGYTCDDQGIRRNAQDVYDASLDCQWVDVTDVPEGDYVLRIRINTEHLLGEQSYANNEVRVPITVPAPPADVDVTVACEERIDGTDRDCGWSLEGEHTCEPGSIVSAGCSAACTLGECTGDPMIRVCPTETGVTCTTRYALGTNDDSGCARRDTCSRLRFVCPASGSYNVFTGPYESTGSATCTVATR